MIRSILIFALTLSALSSALLAEPAPKCVPDEASMSSKNKQLVLDFWRVVIEAKDLSRVSEFLSPDMTQHNPTMRDGIKGFDEFAKALWKGQPRRPVEAVLRSPPALVLADGDLVQLVFRRPTADPSRPGETYDRYTFDLYRVAGNKIVEHWDGVAKSASSAPNP